MSSLIPSSAAPRLPLAIARSPWAVHNFVGEHFRYRQPQPHASLIREAQNTRSP
jgi:hypothetical protein